MSSPAEKAAVVDHPNKRPRISMDSYAAPIKVVVGTEKKEFYLHKDLLCLHSEFFKIACSEKWDSGRTNTVILEEDDPTIFSIFVTWFTTNDMENSAELEELPVQGFVRQDIELESYQTRWLQLVKCFVLGDFLQSIEFRNCVISRIIATCLAAQSGSAMYAAPSAETIRFAWEKTLAGSVIRRLILDTCTTRCRSAEIERITSLEGLSFYRELAETCIELHEHCKVRKTQVWQKDQCRYHEHSGPEYVALCKALTSNEEPIVAETEVIELASPGSPRPVRTRGAPTRGRSSRALNHRSTYGYPYISRGLI